MAKTKIQKKEIIDRLEQAFKDATSAVFVSFTKINATDESDMRKQLRDAGIKYFVAKKTLIGRALNAIGHENVHDMQGEIAVVYNTQGSDASAPARVIHEIAQKLKDKLAIAGGIFEGSLRDARAMSEIATIPAMPVLRGMFAQVINSPRQRFAVVLSKVAESKSA